ncbi:MAG: hypothetical protein ACYDCG_15070 [Candidatus Acidiferrales bacterium]
MQFEKKRLAGSMKWGITGIALSLLLGGSGERLYGQSTTATKNAEKKAVTTSKFYCNTKALDPAERAHHKELTDKLLATRKEIVETDKGYEFQYSPASVSLAELADWVVAEGKCCPFFDFHIDLEQEGKLLCLRLTGEQGIKPFIRSEFQIPAR